MKKILLLAGASIFALQLSAQQWVSTTPENKKAVLEEFTGVNCVWCPDGHKRANEMAANNPGKVILINIHSGGYAVPGAGQPDFRTAVGEVIDNASDLTGYPSGQINRTVPSSPMKPGGLAMDRGQWVNEANKALSQASPVNVAVKSSINPKTRELTVETEIYYTANAANASNYLTVFLLEDNLFGDQKENGSLYPSNWITVDGKKLYKHNHVLRMALTSNNFGDKIDSTHQGYYEYRKYTKILPESQVNTDLKFYDLKVVAFVSEESGKGITNGAEAEVEYDTNVETDLAINNLTSQPSSLCVNTINPKAEVTNMSSNSITGFDIKAIINGTEYTESFSGTLASGAKTTIDWGNLNLTQGGNYSVEIKGFKNVNSNDLFDVNQLNNGSGFTGLGFNSNAMTTVKGTFENGMVDAHFGLDKSENAQFTPIYTTTVSRIGAENTKGTVRYSIHSSWNVSGLPGYITFGEIDMPAVNAATKPVLKYYYAYSDKGNGSPGGAYGGTAPTIRVEVSEDCGATWTNINEITASETGQPAQAGAFYVPLSAHYIPVYVDMDDYEGKSVLVRVAGVPGTGGNALYIDQIGLTMNTPTAVEEAKNALSINLYPNPANGSNVNLNFELPEASNLNIDIFNALGQNVQTVASNTSFAAGANLVTIPTENLAAGMYQVTIRTATDVQTQALQVVK